MRAMWGWTGAGLVLAAGVAASCAPSETPVVTESAPARTESASPAPAAPPVATTRNTDELRARIAARADSADRALRKLRGLSREDRADLRKDVNATHLAAAQAAGPRASSEAEISRLRRSGRLVELEDSTKYWVLRDLTYSVPFATPDARATLTEAARRFQARMDSAGAPPFRLTVTSVLRTDESQADLRKRNPNAAAGVSAHEFGTTVDISHIRYAPPASEPGLPAELAQLQDSLLADVAKKHAATLQGELGRVLRDMRSEGKLLVMMERQQPVYHTTARR